MADSESPTTTTNSAATANDNAVEDTPLLGDIQHQARTRRRSSLVGNTEHGYHTIPPNVPEEHIRPEQGLHAVFAVLSVLLVGQWHMYLYFGF